MVDVGSQPLDEWNEVPASNARNHLGILLARCTKELRGSHCSECVAREIPNRSLHPVDVLHATAAIIGYINAHQVFHAFTPGVGQVDDL